MTPNTTQQWRENKELLDAAKSVLTHQVTQRMLHVLESDLPLFPSLPRMGAQPNDFTYNYGIVVGWKACLAALQSLSEPLPVQKEPSSDFSEQNQ